jgi:hypothetical protein
VYGSAHGDALGAGAHGVGGVFDVCTRQNVRCWVGCGAGVGGGRDGCVEEERCADAEEGVWACSILG